MRPQNARRTSFCLSPNLGTTFLKYACFEVSVVMLSLDIRKLCYWLLMASTFANHGERDDYYDDKDCPVEPVVIARYWETWTRWFCDSSTR